MRRELLLPILWTFIIVVLSVIPLPVHGSEIPKLLDVGHVVSYAILAILWTWSLGKRMSGLIVSIITTPLTEIVQLPLPWRNANLIDVFNNIIGVLIGVVLYNIIKVMERSKK